MENENRNAGSAGGGGDMMAALAAGAASGLVQGGMSLIGGHMQNKSNEKMNAQNLELAYKTRDDTLAQNAFNNRMAVADRGFRDRQAAYQRRLDRHAAYVDRIKRDAQFRNNLLQMINMPRR